MREARCDRALIALMTYSFARISAAVGMNVDVVSPFGLHDTAGNVWEWCWDVYGSYKDLSRLSNEGRSARAAARVVRGGSSTYVSALRARWQVQERLRCPVRSVTRSRRSSWNARQMPSAVTCASVST